ncbi:putative claudin-24 [Eucyclogobius newberryi]|uniref:putative claudin-24 n=1 Tax=Eucyclogobius newberryi TaxID=166745 RepID=UPI003B58E4D2
MPWSDAAVPSPPLLSLWPLLELLSLASLLFTWLLALCCCLSPWMEYHLELVELERVQVGLWSDCVVQKSVFSCKAHNSLLDLPPALLLGRGLLLGALVSGAAAIAVTVLGLSLLHTPKCLGVAASWARKRRLRGCGVVLCLVSAVLEAFPVSWAGHITAQRFRQDAVLKMAPRWDLGLGLFLGWTSASLYILTAGALWSSCREEGGARTLGGGVTVQRGGARQEYV